MVGPARGARAVLGRAEGGARERGFERETAERWRPAISRLPPILAPGAGGTQADTLRNTPQAERLAAREHSPVLAQDRVADVLQ